MPAYVVHRRVFVNKSSVNCHRCLCLWSRRCTSDIAVTTASLCSFTCFPCRCTRDIAVTTASRCAFTCFSRAGGRGVPFPPAQWREGTERLPLFLPRPGRMCAGEVSASVWAVGGKLCTNPPGPCPHHCYHLAFRQSLDRTDCVLRSYNSL